MRPRVVCTARARAQVADADVTARSRLGRRRDLQHHLRRLPAGRHVRRRPDERTRRAGAVHRLRALPDQLEHTGRRTSAQDCLSRASGRRAPRGARRGRRRARAAGAEAAAPRADRELLAAREAPELRQFSQDLMILGCYLRLEAPTLTWRLACDTRGRAQTALYVCGGVRRALDGFAAGRVLVYPKLWITGAYVESIAASVRSPNAIGCESGLGALRTALTSCRFISLRGGRLRGFAAFRPPCSRS
jgi:hypothetical protein